MCFLSLQVTTASIWVIATTITIMDGLSPAQGLHVISHMDKVGAQFPMDQQVDPLRILDWWIQKLQPTQIGLLDSWAIVRKVRRPDGVGMARIWFSVQRPIVMAWAMCLATMQRTEGMTSISKVFLNAFSKEVDGIGSPVCLVVQEPGSPKVNPEMVLKRSPWDVLFLVVMGRDMPRGNFWVIGVLRVAPELIELRYVSYVFSVWVFWSASFYSFGVHTHRPYF